MQKRLLIIDGHLSHIIETFINIAIDRNILLIVFPPYCTHRLQLLDISVFSPLATAYLKGLNEYIHVSQGFSSMTKRLFWSLFWPAWDIAVSKKNIMSGFSRAGIEPFNPLVVLD
jgi:hypothetical protein